MSRDRRKEEIRKLIQEDDPEALPSSKVVSIRGDGNVVGDGNTVIRTDKVEHRPRVQVSPGDQHISDEQAATLKRMVGEVVETESLVKMNPKSYQAVWSALNRHCRVPQYRLIPAESFEKARRYLSQWLGRLGNAKTAPRKIPDWRKSRYAYIHTSLKQLNAESDFRDLLAKRYNATSMTELSDAELNEVRDVVAGWKRAGR
ncbi:MAG: ORF6C domain-containing protein [Salinisphaeraceae bacterium]